MKIQKDNVQKKNAVYEGILTTDGEGNYWLSQGDMSAQLDTRGLNEDLLEENNKETISVVGSLHLEQRGDSAILNYKIEPRMVAPLEGFNPENSTYVTRIGDNLLEASSDKVGSFNGDPEDLEKAEEVSYGNESRTLT